MGPTIWTAHQLVTLVLAMLGAGWIGGIPTGYWLARLPLPTAPPRDVELGELADTLDQAAAIVRERAVTPPHPNTPLPKDRHVRSDPE